MNTIHVHETVPLVIYSENASLAVGLFNQYHLVKLLLDTLQMFGVCLDLSLTAGKLDLSGKFPGLI